MGSDNYCDRRNQCLHVDYLSLQESYNDTRYVLVLKDELTHYCELIATDAPTSLTAAKAILDWYKRFCLPEEWISDNGSHFKAELMTELASRLQAIQGFVPVYSPWINGTVERVNRDILQVLRVMLMELHLDNRNCLYLLPLVQANLNHSVVESLGGHAPMELFAGLPASSQLDCVVVPDGGRTRVLTLDLAKVHDQLDELLVHLHALHTKVTDRKESKRLANMAGAKGTVCNFKTGDFVLWSRVDKRLHGDKLLVRWVGPFCITEALSHSFRVKHLLTNDEFEVHGCRLKHYCDADLDVTEELRQHIANQEIVLWVQSIESHRSNQAVGEWQLYVAWRGLEDDENSWEPFASIFADVPTLVCNYVATGAHGELEPQLQ